MPKVETILTPALFHLYNQDLTEKNVVVTDILRATTTMCVAFENQAREMIPVSTPEDALVWQQRGYLAAAERSGVTVQGFELGNSPQEYSKEKVGGQRIAITTTNGTRALEMSKGAASVYVGAFRNVQALAEVLKKENRDVLLFCAGWKNKFNLEDTLYAGCLFQSLGADFVCADDATAAAVDLYNLASPDLAGYLQKANHVQRFQTLHIESDLEVCLRMNTSTLVPRYIHGKIALYGHETMS
ncbi:MAG: 2-phosphosulfolactate phosphatase [Bacteroidetes bacterium]|nr:2-phosphosulfolactate phosphatase [Bacteroidota bacterium]